MSNRAIIFDNTATAKSFKTDIVVIGAGAAGLPAALAAAEAGVKNITVLEKTTVPGGNGSLCHGIFAVGTPAQKKAGYKVTTDEVFLDEMETAKGKINPILIRNFINKSLEMYQWLEDKGLKFEHLAAMGSALPGPGSGLPMHMFKAKLDKDMAIGRRLIETLVKECQNKGVQILCDTPARKILKDDDGEIWVLATTGDKELRFNCKSVIIAAGGFGGNKEMLNKYFPGYGDIYRNSVTQVTGDGLVMAEEAGAAIEDEIGIILIGPHHYPWARSLNLLVRQPHILLVNKKGERYIGSSGGGGALSRQPDKICYGLLDSAYLKNLIQKREVLGGDMGDQGAWLDELMDDLQKESAEGKTKIANSLDELAGYIGAKPEVLKATVERYNSYCDQGYDAEFLKAKELLVPLRTPPYYAVLGRQGFDSTLGGIKINHTFEVISKDDNPIKGLYAVGDNAGGWVSRDYTPHYPGTALAFAIYSGYTAGTKAANLING